MRLRSVEWAAQSLTAAARIVSERVSLVELRNGKLVIKQKLLSFEKMSETLQGVCWIVNSFHATICEILTTVWGQRSFSSVK